MESSTPHNPENPDPNRLLPPAHPRNFLVSPPGSPPEGWEPIVEDAPNDQTLASDLIKALDSLQVDPNNAHRTRWIGSDDDSEADGTQGPGMDPGNVQRFHRGRASSSRARDGSCGGRRPGGIPLRFGCKSRCGLGDLGRTSHC
jgi:hypothetical protein